jgi:hypothetical protein
MSKAYNVAFNRKKQLLGEDLDWCFSFENKLETLRILNIIGSALTDKGRQHKKQLEKWIETNCDRYLQLTNL